MIDSTKIFVAYDISIHVFDVFSGIFITISSDFVFYQRHTSIDVLGNFQFVLYYTDTILFDTLYYF